MAKTISACVVTQNEETIIAYSIDSLLRECDEVIVVDGISHDRTEAIIKAKAKELGVEKKLKYFKNRFVSLNAQRNFYLQRATCDYIFYVDSDEIITVEHIKNIREYAEKYDLILVRSYNFFIDMWHLLHDDRWNNGFMMPRCFKNLGSRLSYAPFSLSKGGDHDLMIDTTKHCHEYWNSSQILCSKSDAIVYHVGHAIGPEIERRRMRFFLRQYSPEMPASQYDENINKNFYFDKRIWKDGININPNVIQKFNGHHPEIIKSHPLYNVRIIKD